MNVPYAYTLKLHTKQVDTLEFMARYRDVARFSPYCESCPNYGNNWACPPFEFDVETFFAQHKQVVIIATQVFPTDLSLPFSATQELLFPIRQQLQKELHRMEKLCNGRFFAYTGSCTYCPKDSCTRKDGKPCRHPQLIRPSLEACGVDVGLTTSELFGIELQWGKEGKMPPYLIMLSALFHNQEEVVCNIHIK